MTKYSPVLNCCVKDGRGISVCLQVGCIPEVQTNSLFLILQLCPNLSGDTVKHKNRLVLFGFRRQRIQTSDNHSLPVLLLLWDTKGSKSWRVRILISCNSGSRLPSLMYPRFSSSSNSSGPLLGLHEGTKAWEH